MELRLMGPIVDSLLKWKQMESKSFRLLLLNKLLKRKRKRRKISRKMMEKILLQTLVS